MNRKGYYRYPNVHGEKVFFISEDDLWQVSLSGGSAIRLTNVLSDVSNPLVSDDGEWIAFTGREEGTMEICIMPSRGGSVNRMTFFGKNSYPVRWRNGKLIFRSNTGQPFLNTFELFELNIDTGEIKKLKFGEATEIAFSGKVTLIGRNIGDPSRWKRYKGGTAGHLWIDRTGNGKFERFLKNINGNIASPMLIDSKVYFISDHEGHGNLYSSDLTGKKVTRLTDHADYYVRNAHTDGKTIVYHAGGDLFRYNIENGNSEMIEVDYRSGKHQLSRKYHNAMKYLESFNISNDGSSLVINSRGKSFSFGNWEGPVFRHGAKDGIRYRCSKFLIDDKRIITASDESGEYKLEIYNIKKSEREKRFEKLDIGIPYEIKINPKKEEVVVSNHRHELIWVDLKTGISKIIAKNKYKQFGGYDWSPDGNWITYASSTSTRDSVIYLHDLRSGKSHQVSDKVLFDYNPVFDPAGNYLYFISTRVFDPVYDTTHFDLGFPKSYRLYLITLNKDIKPPFVKDPKPIVDEEISKHQDDEKKPKDLKIDLDGIQNRIVAFPLEEALFSNLVAGKDRVYYLVDSINGSLNSSWSSQEEEATKSLYCYDFEEMKEKHILDHVEEVKMSGNKNALVIKVDKELRVIKCTADAPTYTKDHSSYSRKLGWIDLSRVNLEINYHEEWKQMFREAWKLQREFFWKEDMHNIDWQNVYDNYLPLVERLGSRKEFSDLIWEMQGELGTSHAYEFGGEYRETPVYQHGFLGVDLEYDKKNDSYRITNIAKGDTWKEKDSSPFLRPGVNVTTGMRIVEVNGTRADKENHPFKLLANLAEKEVEIKVSDKAGKEIKSVNVLIPKTENDLRYRDWVEANRSYVHRKSENKIGYVHIPDMGPRGYAEFHRYFLTELKYDGLIVDVRFNGGGHVSQLLLEKLARKRIGFDIPRWMGIDPYPVDSPAGPMAAITNEKAGSDGDMFSHAFKLMKLGKLIGKRTWGGVVGIWPRNWLVDGTITTQPEFSTWFVDVGFEVENYGTDPDIDIDITPMDYANGKDPQLDIAIEIVLKELKSNPGLKPDFDKKLSRKTGKRK